MMESLENLLMRAGVSIYDKDLTELADEQEYLEMDEREMFSKYKERNCYR